MLCCLFCLLLLLLLCVQVPLETLVRQQSDAGVPVVVSDAGSAAGAAYVAIAGAVKAALSASPCDSLKGGGRPSISIE